MARSFVQIDINPLDEARVLRKLTKVRGNTSKVLVNALNDTIKTGKTRASTEIRNDIRPRTETETPKQYVDRRLKVRRATVANMSAAISADKRGLLLTRFQARYVKSRGGVTVKIKPTGTRQLVRTAFIVTNLKYSGVSGVAVRDKSKGSGIRVLYGPSVSQVFNVELENLQNQLQPVLTQKTAAEVSKAVRGIGRYA